jgi:hypothetical protein
MTISNLTEDTLALDALKAGKSAERPGGRLLQLGAGRRHQARVASFRHPVRALTPKNVFEVYGTYPCNVNTVSCNGSQLHFTPC